MIDVLFWEAASEDYKRLDGSQRKWVEEAIKRCAKADGQIGEPLANTSIAKLHGCKKLKNQRLGLRIVFRVNVQDGLDVIEIIFIGKREDFIVYQDAGKRLQSISEKMAEWTNFPI